MKAIVLAAGQGRRLWPFTANCPKCLLPIGAGSILEQQLTNLEGAGIREVVLVCGFGIERIRAVLGAFRGQLSVKLSYNPFYALADNLVSLWTVRAEMDRDFLLLNGDNVFHPQILQHLLAAQKCCCLMIRRKACYDQDDMKLHVEGGQIRAIGKALPAAQAESVGIMRFAGEGRRCLMGVLEDLISRAGTTSKLRYVAGVQRLIDLGHPVAGLEVGELPWADVDTPEDLRFVRRHLQLFAGGEAVAPGRLREAGARA
ncbi:MAG: phosphocholine cytidylyltransferase family protein [Candidatus Latescibacteria bacterium]|nr:phosphocholine cytidylyltransferase family protein [Candidatus Latescibacterota bacterium]